MNGQPVYLKPEGAAKKRKRSINSVPADGDALAMSRALNVGKKFRKQLGMWLPYEGQMLPFLQRIHVLWDETTCAPF